jgi:flagellar protein FlbT
MTKPMQISLRAGERIYINGAVIRVDRKTTIELLNDVTFLLEGHVLQVEDTTTPLRQLYFVLQTMLMDPRNASHARELFRTLHASTLRSFRSEAVVSELHRVAGLVEADRVFEALRAIRGLYPVEAAILQRDETPKAA